MGRSGDCRGCHSYPSLRFRSDLLGDAGKEKIGRTAHQAEVGQINFGKVAPSGPGGKAHPGQSNGQGQRPPALRAHGMDKFKRQEHRNGQKRHRRKNDPMVGLGGKDHDHRHIPSAGKALKGVVLGLHALIGKIHRTGESDDNDRHPSGPTGQQATGK